MQIHDVNTQPPKKLVAARLADALYFKGCNGGVYRVYGGEVYSVKQYASLEELVKSSNGHTPLYEGDTIHITF